MLNNCSQEKWAYFCFLGVILVILHVTIILFCIYLMINCSDYLLKCLLTTCLILFNEISTELKVCYYCVYVHILATCAQLCIFSECVCMCV